MKLGLGSPEVSNLVKNWPGRKIIGGSRPRKVPPREVSPGPDAAPMDWSGLVWVWFLALMTTPCPTLSDELVGSQCRYVEGLNSKQSLLTVNTCEMGTWGALLSGRPPSS